MSQYRVKLMEVRTRQVESVAVYALDKSHARPAAIRIARRFLGADATFDILEITDESVPRFKTGEWQRPANSPAT